MASEKITAIVEELKTLSVLELSELVKAVEEEFGVSAAAQKPRRYRRKHGKQKSAHSHYCRDFINDTFFTHGEHRI